MRMIIILYFLLNLNNVNSKTLAMSDEDLLTFICNTKLSESSDLAKYWVIHC